MHLPGKPQQLPSQLWKNLSVLSWFTHPELECGSANRTLVEIPHVKEELDVETEVSGENPFREGAAFPTSRHSQGLSLCSQYNHLSPPQFPPPPLSSVLNLSLSFGTSQPLSSFLNLSLLSFGTPQPSLHLCVSTSHSTGSTLYSSAVLPNPTPVSLPELASWVTSSASGTNPHPLSYPGLDPDVSLFLIPSTQS